MIYQCIDSLNNSFSDISATQPRADLVGHCGQKFVHRGQLIGHLFHQKMAFPIDNDSASFSLFPKRTVLAFSRKSSVVSFSHRTFFCKVANRSQVGPKIGFYSKQSFTLFVNFAPGHGGAACEGSVKFIKCYKTLLINF